MPRRKNKQKKLGDVWRQDLEGDCRKKPIRRNQLFVKYYQGQDFVPDGEFDQFYETLKEDLPVTFRITGTRRQATQLLKVIKEQFLNGLTNLTVDDKTLPAPKSISWYPDELAWHIDTTKKAVRNNTLLKNLHNFLIAETESGNISRQEAVSMIPPLLLDVQPHHKILDMCAAPGSKTAQLIEYLHADESNPIPDGFIIANDLDNKRCYMMVHQIKRLGTPNCMVVNENAYNFPKLRSSKEGEKLEFYLFDRVLADVPCSGDGTMRKNPDVWGKWKPISGHGMHGLQTKILKRGLELLTVGGRLVYSTCSLNPVENEAVIAEMVRKSEGAIEIIDVSKSLPGLRSVPGVKTWKCMDKYGNWYDGMSEVPENLHGQFTKTMFSPTEEERKTFNLERCMRILPHHQNTGAFFICVIEKVRQLPWMKASKPNKDSNTGTGKTVAMETPAESSVDGVVKSEDVVTKSENVSTTADAMESSDSVDVTVKTSDGSKECLDSPTSVPKETNNLTEDGSKETALKRKADPENKEFQLPQKKKFKGYKEDPFLFVETDDPFWQPIKDFYQLPDSFPLEQILYRSEQGSRKTLYFVSPALRNIVECNSERVRFINMGVKFLARSASPLVKDCDFRITQESLPIVGHFYESRTIDISKEDVEIILCQDSPYMFKFTEPVRTRLEELCPGSVVLRYKPTKGDDGPDCVLLFCAWRGNMRARSYVPKYVRQHYFALFGWKEAELRAKLAASKPAKNNSGEINEMNSDEEGLPESDDENNERSEKKEIEEIKEKGVDKTETNVQTEKKEENDGNVSDKLKSGDHMDLKDDVKCSENIVAGDQLDVKVIPNEKDDGKDLGKMDTGEEPGQELKKAKSNKECSEICEELKKTVVDGK